MSSRLVSSSLAALLALAAAPTLASAQSPTPAEQATKLAEEGKGLSAEGKHAEASEKFRQAVVLSPDGKFYLYLCISLSKEGKLGEAINACDAVERNGADEKTLTKTRQMTESLRTTMKQQGMDPDKALADGRAQNEGTEPGGGASPGGGAGSSGAGAGVGAPPPAQPQYVGAPPVSVYGAAAPPNEYTWSLGGTFFGAGTAIGKEGAYASGGAGIRLHADYIAVPSLKLGGQAFLGVTSVSGEDNYNDLTIVDFGLAGFKHFCVSRVCITPLAGVMLSGMQPSYDGEDDTSVNMFAVGGRLEGAAALALGSRYEHVVSATLGANVYSAAVGDYEEDPEFFGLDEPSTAVYFGLGYTYRFNTPLGQSPFITFD